MLTTDLHFQNCPDFPSSWNRHVLCSLTGFHHKRRAHSTGLLLRNGSFCTGCSTLFLLPKVTRNSWSHGVWEQKKRNNIRCKCKKWQRHNGKAWDRNKTSESLLSIMRLDRTQILKSLTVIFLGTCYNGKIKTKNTLQQAQQYQIQFHFYTVRFQNLSDLKIAVSCWKFRKPNLPGTITARKPCTEGTDASSLPILKSGFCKLWLFPGLLPILWS